MSFWRKIKIKINNRWNDYDFKKKFLLVLFWLSIVSVYLASYLDAFINGKIDDITGVKTTGPIYQIFSIIPILSVILGIYYRKKGYLCKKNIVGGIIMTIIMLISSLSGFFTYFNVKDSFFDDYSYVNNLEDIIKVEFPDNGEIFTDKSFNFKKDDYELISSSEVTFSNVEEIKKFNDSIKNSNIWVSNNSSYLKMLEPVFFISDSDYYMVYIMDLNIYNKAPLNSGRYYTYYLEYNVEEAKLIVYEYYLNFSI